MIELTEKTTGRSLLFKNTKEASFYMGRSSCYISNKMQKGDVENKLYSWRRITETKCKLPSLPPHVVVMLKMHGNTVVGKRTIKKFGGVSNLLAAIEKESGIKCAHRLGEPFIGKNFIEPPSHILETVRSEGGR